MLLLIPSLAFLINLFAKAIPNSDQITLASSNRNELLVPRQIIEASPSVACCDDCAERYEYNTFWDAFNNLCGWIGAEPMELWQSQIYYTQNYYCQPGSVTCMHMEIQYLCSDPLVYSMNYDGYMDYFDFVINPSNGCDGPPYPGAQVRSPDGCWMFQATADTLDKDSSRITLECDESGRYRHHPGSNATVRTGPEHTFG